MFELGAAAGKIAFVIAMAAVIGECLTVSGGAERIVTWLLHLFKEQRAGAAFHHDARFFGGRENPPR